MHLVVLFKQKTAYEMRISDWSSDVCSSDLVGALVAANPGMPFTIGEIYRRLTTGDPKSDLPKALEEARGAGQRLSQACVSAIQDFASASDNTFSGIKQTITARLNLWLNPVVDAATSASDFDQIGTAT